MQQPFLRSVSPSFSGAVLAKAVRTFGVAIALVVLLAGCTVFVVPGDRTVQGRVSLSLDLDRVIASFEPTRGPGATFLVGEEVRFRIRTRESGFVSLTTIDPDGRVSLLARNVRVQAGRTITLPRPDSRTAFVAEPPTGFHQVRASFTADRVDPSRVRFEGLRGENEWNSALRIELRPAEVRDVTQTFLFIERR